VLLGKLQVYTKKENKRCWINFEFMLVWTSWLLGKLEVYALLDKVVTDQTEFVLFNTKSYVCKNSLFYFCRCLDPVLEGAKHLDPVSEGAKHIHFSQFSCEKRK
jgi:hypothetical protein